MGPQWFGVTQFGGGPGPMFMGGPDMWGGPDMPGGMPHGPGVDEPEFPAGLPTNPCGPDVGPQGTSWGGPPPGVCGGPGEGP